MDSNSSLEGAEGIDFEVFKRFLEQPVSHHDSHTEQTPNTRYNNFSLIGEGGQKKVYRCFDNKLRRWVAYATSKDSESSSTHNFIVFEALIASYLTHPNIVNIYDIDRNEEQASFFTMDLSEKDLLQFIHNELHPQTKRIELFLAVCEALAYAHKKGVLHLDLKPQNIQFINNELLLSDWGNSEIAQKHVDNENLIDIYKIQPPTLYNQCKGSLAYMSPEQASQGGEHDETSDVFSLGCLLYFFITGEDPQRQAPQETIDLRPLKALSPNVHFSLYKIIAKATSKNKVERYQTVNGLISDLSKFQKGYLTSVDPSEWYHQLSAFVTRHPKAILTSLASLSLAVCAFFYHYNSSQIQEVEANELKQKVEEKSLRLESISNNLIELSEYGYHNFWLADPRPIVENDFKRLEVILSNDPTNLKVKDRLFHLNLIIFNPAGALQYYDQSNKNHRILFDLFDGFKRISYSCNSDKRPNIQTLNNFLRKNKLKGGWKNEFMAQELIAQIIHYDWHKRFYKKGYNRTLMLTFKSLFSDRKGFDIKEGNRHLMLADHSFSPFLKLGVMQALFVKLRYDKITIETKAPVFLGYFAQTTFQVIDLSNSSNIKTTNNAYLMPRLRRLYLPRNYDELPPLKEYIQSNHDVEYISPFE